MKKLYCILIAVIVLSLGLAAQSTAATCPDVAGTYEVTYKRTFKAKGLGKDNWQGSDLLILEADGTFMFGDATGTYSCDKKGKKIRLNLDESGLDELENYFAEIISDLAFKKGTDLEPWEITCIIQKVKISKIKINKKTAKPKGKVKIEVKGRASAEVDGKQEKGKFSYKGKGKIQGLEPEALKEEIKSKAIEILPDEEYSVLEDELGDATVLELEDLDDAIDEFLDSVNEHQNEEQNLSASMINTRSVPYIAYKNIKDAKSMYKDLFGDINFEDAKKAFLNAGMGFKRVVLGGAGGSLTIALGAGGEVTVESGSGPGQAYDFLNFSRLDYFTRFCAGSVGVKIGAGISLDGKLSLLASEGIIFGFEKDEKYSKGPSVGKNYSIGLSGKLLKGLELSIGVGSSRSLKGTCSLSGCNPFTPSGESTGKYSFSAAVKVSVSGGASAEVSGNLSKGGTYSCNKSPESVYKFLKKSNPKKIDTITAGFKMASHLIISNGGPTGSAITLPAAATAILYGILYDEDLIDNSSIIPTAEITPQNQYHGDEYSFKLYLENNTDEQIYVNNIERIEYRDGKDLYKDILDDNKLGWKTSIVPPAKKVLIYEWTDIVDCTGSAGTADFSDTFIFNTDAGEFEAYDKYSVDCNDKNRLADHTMCEDVDAGFWPINRTNTFFTDEDQAVSWLRIENYESSSGLKVKWKWYDPNNILRREYPESGAPGSYWGYHFWDELPIRGYLPENKPGTWKVRVYINGDFKYEESFVIKP